MTSPNQSSPSSPSSAWLIVVTLAATVTWVLPGGSTRADWAAVQAASSGAASARRRITAPSGRGRQR